jgi:hypothetical protein
MNGNVRIAVQSGANPKVAPAIAYVPMPLGRHQLSP